LRHFSPNIVYLVSFNRISRYPHLVSSAYRCHPLPICNAIRPSQNLMTYESCSRPPSTLRRTAPATIAQCYSRSSQSRLSRGTQAMLSASLPCCPYIALSLGCEVGFQRILDIGTVACALACGAGFARASRSLGSIFSLFLVTIALHGALLSARASGLLGADTFVTPTAAGCWLNHFR